LKRIYSVFILGRDSKKNIRISKSTTCFWGVNTSYSGIIHELTLLRYELLDVDPFWVPTTEEELEDWGVKADHENIAKVYMDKVRERKGLFVSHKITESAEKQRTLKH
jgi:hypothetical protein